ncbi:MAG: SgcJ/EcaC family oxidoreductase [Pseudomonadota bacterium]
MHRLLPFMLVLALPILPAGPALAEGNDPHGADRQALIQVFHEMEAAINAQDVERMVAQMTPDATVTWLNGEISRGHDEIRAYYQRMVKGPDRYIDKYTTAARIGAHARFYGDVAVADGSMRDSFFPVSRAPFQLDSRWTSTSVKVDGHWKVASLHLSSNVFTNDLMSEATQAIWKVGIGGALAGLLLGGLVTWWRMRG